MTEAQGERIIELLAMIDKRFEVLIAFGVLFIAYSIFKKGLKFFGIFFD